MALDAGSELNAGEAKGLDVAMPSGKEVHNDQQIVEPALNEKHAYNNSDHESGIPSDDTEDDYGARPACFRNTAQEFLFVFIATMAMGMNPFLMGTTTVIPEIVSRALNMSQAEVTWFTASSSLASGAFLLFFGRIADLFGQKWMIVLSFFFFSVFSLAAGFAKTPIVLDVLNGVLGLLSAAAVPPAQGKLSKIYGKPSRRKNAAFACFSAGNPVGFAMGMVFAGIATQLLGWRASFYLLAIIYLVLAVAAVFCVPADTISRRTLEWSIVKQLDLVGMVLTIAGIGMFSAALSLGSGAPQGWKTDYVLATLIIGFVLIICFVFWEKFYSHPLMPMHIWKDKNFSLLMTILTLGFMAFPPASFFIALFFQRIWNFTALESAVHLLPLAIMGIIVNVFAGAFMHRINNKLLMFIGAFSYTISFLLLALNRTSSSYWAFCFPSFLLTVIGADLEFNVANMYVMTQLPDDQQGIAGGIFQTVTRLFTTIGFGLITAVFDAVAKKPSLGGYYREYPESQPYSAAFWYATGAAGLSTVFVLFLTIGTQGGRVKSGGAS
ncbi:MFS transporter-like protein 89 [Elsinoe australis]|uniref:MFS transporter-like protein 89 n=1 Tax=Elsinoe australis TaxID=40998 RepID=A0A4U7B029_9PEZI|nr:MFS transporter-like protein 89 [Elsinoe australis]